jgi:hypothetical protein
VRRKLFNLATTISLVLCMGTVALWVSSFLAWPRLDYSKRDTRHGVFTGWVVSSSIGRVGVYRTRSWQKLDGEDRATWNWYAVPQNPLPLRERLGLVGPSFEFRNKPFGGATAIHYWSLNVPYWVLLLALVVLPIFWMVQCRRMTLRRAQFRCLCCGYDLRATPDRCPECGRLATPHESASVKV